jgi:methionyl-tRNA formyltransferase
MRVAFAGTHRFAELVLAGLLATPHRPVVLVTNPDRPRGRHGTPRSPAIKALADRHDLPVLQPERVAHALPALRAAHADVFVACAYGQIVGPSLLDAMPCLVVHPSRVPRWRGAAPVERALMAGETGLGIAVLRMTRGVDEGPVAEERTVEVPRGADAGQAYELLAPAAVAALTATLDGMEAGTVRWREQEGVPTYAAKIERDERVIDWGRPAQVIADQVRALSPHIGAVTELLGRRTTIWRARPGDGPLPPRGPSALVLPAGEGWVEVLELQQEGRRRVGAAEFLRGAGRALAR